MILTRARHKCGFICGVPPKILNIQKVLVGRWAKYENCPLTSSVVAITFSPLAYHQPPFTLTHSLYAIFLHSLPARVGCSFQGKLFSILNCFASFLLDIIFVPALPSRTLYSLLLHLDPREKTSSPMQDLFCSRRPLTYPGLASVQCGLHGRTDYPL